MSRERSAWRRLAHVLEASLRRPGLVLAPAVVLSVAAAALALALPVSYRAGVLLRAEWETDDEPLLRRPGLQLAERRSQAVKRRLSEPVLLERTLEQAAPYAVAGETPPALAAQLERLRSELRVRPLAASVFVVEFEHPDPARAARVPNALASALARESDDARRTADAPSGPGRWPRFELVRPAAVPVTPESRGPARFALAGALVGLLLGFAGAVLAERRDHSVKGPEDLAQILPVPLLATLPELRPRGGRR